MVDIKFIRENPDKVKEGVQKKGIKIDIDKILDLDEKRREYIKEVEDLRAKQNKLGKKEGDELRSSSRFANARVIKEAQRLKSQIKELTPKLEKIEKELDILLMEVPNLPADNVPVGKDDRDNIVLREWGEKPKFNFKPKDYLEIAEKLDLIDTKRAAKAVGTRFGYLKKESVSLEFALISLAFDTLTKQGFIPVIPPVMLKSEMARGMGYIEQADREDAYYLPKDDLYLVGTSEQSIGVMHADEVFTEKDLPRRYAGFSTCFRREAGSYGKDTRGIMRVHQFDKVEMFSFCHPEKSKEEHQFLLSMEEKLMQSLRVPYRVIQMCTADIAFPQAAKYDIEAWMPGQNQYRETHSTSTCTDFQARRLNVRYKNKSGKLDFVHTLNGTAFAIGRMLIAIIENYQQKDGSVVVPGALQKYLKFKVIK